MPSVCGVCGATTNATSASGSSSGRSSIACTGTGSVRGRRATLVTEATSKPESRRSIAAPIWP